MTPQQGQQDPNGQGIGTDQQQRRGHHENLTRCRRLLSPTSARWKPLPALGIDAGDRLTVKPPVGDRHPGVRRSRL
jgi:hypothetical protein